MKQSVSLVHTTVVKVTIFSWQIFGAGLYCTMEGIVALHIALAGKSYKAKVTKPKLQSQKKYLKYSQQQSSDFTILNRQDWSMSKDGLKQLVATPYHNSE